MKIRDIAEIEFVVREQYAAGFRLIAIATTETSTPPDFTTKKNEYVAFFEK